MVHSFFLWSTYVACFASSSWHCLVGRAGGDRYQVDTARDGAGRLAEHANRQNCCLQLDSGRSQDQNFCTS